MDDDLPPTQPLDNRVLKDVVAFVDVRSGHDNHSKSVAFQLELLGATIAKNINKKVTHVVFQDGSKTNYTEAKKRGIPLLSVLWVDSCKQTQSHVSENLFQANVSEAYNSKLVRLRKQKSWQPEDEEEVLARYEKRKKQRERRQKLREIRLKYITPGGAQFVHEPPKEPKPTNYNFMDLIPDPLSLRRELLVFDDSSDDDDTVDDEYKVLPLTRRILKVMPNSPVLLGALARSKRYKQQHQNDGIIGELKESHESVPENDSFGANHSANQSVVGSESDKRKSCDGDVIDTKMANEDDFACAAAEVSQMDRVSEVAENPSRAPVRKSLRLSSMRNSEFPVKLKDADTALHETTVNTSSDDISSIVAELKIDDNGDLARADKTPKPVARSRSRNSGRRSNGPNPDNRTARRKSLRFSSKPLSLSETCELEGSRIVESRTEDPEIAINEIVDDDQAMMKKRPRAYSCGEKELRTPYTGSKETEVPASNSSLDDFRTLQPRRKKKRTVLFATPRNSPEASLISPRNLHGSRTMHIVLSNFSLSAKEVLVPVIKNLGKCRLESSVTSTTTHIICGASRRTFSVLLGTVFGCWIVSEDWVYKSLEAGVWQDEAEYEMADSFPTAQASRLALHSTGSTPLRTLFSSIQAISLEENATKMPYRELKSLLKFAGANVVASFRSSVVHIGRAHSYSYSDVICVSELWALDSITANTLLPYDGYKL